jgi:hypothetical protein
VPRRLAAAVLALMFAAEPSAAAGLPCRNSADLATLQFRQLQIELMVAALNCPAPAFDYKGAYAAFIGHTRPALAVNAQHLRGMVRQAGLGEGAVDHYQTELSNHAQIKSLSDETYCDRLAALMGEAARLPPEALEAFAARQIPAPLGGERCGQPLEAAMAATGRADALRRE